MTWTIQDLYKYFFIVSVTNILFFFFNFDLHNYITFFILTFYNIIYFNNIIIVIFIDIINMMRRLS